MYRVWHLLQCLNNSLRRTKDFRHVVKIISDAFQQQHILSKFTQVADSAAKDGREPYLWPLRASVQLSYEASQSPEVV